MQPNVRDTPDPVIRQGMSTSEQRLNVIYVGGYGRSGSTILDMLLSCHPSIVSGGEVARATEIFFDDDASCTCGTSIADCSVWGPVRAAVIEEARGFGRAEDIFERFMGIEGLGRLKRKSDEVTTLAGYDLWRQVNDLALRGLIKAKPGASWVVDSSKTARGAAARPWLLERQLGANVRLMTLRRRAGAVLSSAARGSNRAMEKGQGGTGGIGAALRAYGGWVLANAAVKRLGTDLSADQTHMLTYEALAADPDGVYAELLSWLGLPADPHWQERMATEERHLIGGNRTRFAKPEIRRAALPTRGDPLTSLGLAAGQLIARSRLI